MKFIIFLGVLVFCIITFIGLNRKVPEEEYASAEDATIPCYEVEAQRFGPYDVYGASLFGMVIKNVGEYKFDYFEVFHALTKDSDTWRLVDTSVDIICNEEEKKCGVILNPLKYRFIVIHVYGREVNGEVSPYKAHRLEK